MKKVLIVEDERIEAELFKILLEGAGHKVVGVAHSGEEGIKKARELSPDLIYLDISMEYRTAGIDACRSIKEENPEIKVYFHTAYSKEAFKEELKSIPYDGYIDKADFDRIITGGKT